MTAHSPEPISIPDRMRPRLCLPSCGVPAAGGPRHKTSRNSARLAGPTTGCAMDRRLWRWRAWKCWAEMRYAKLVSAFDRDPSLAGFADSLRMRGFKGALGSGALGFALHQAVGPSAKASWSQADPVAGTEAAWTDAPTTPAAGDALSVGESTISSRVAPKSVPLRTGRNRPGERCPIGRRRRARLAYSPR